MAKKDDKKAKDTKTKLEKAQKDDKNAKTKAPDNSNNTSFPAIMNGQYTKDLSFENPLGPMSILAAQQGPQVQVQIDMDYQKIEIEGRDDIDIYEVVLHVRVLATAKKKTAFIVELSHATSCTVTDVPKDKLDFFLRTEIPRFGFPFARQIIADVTAQGGFQPLYLAPVNFVALYQQKIQKAQNAAADDAEKVTKHA